MQQALLRRWWLANEFLFLAQVSLFSPASVEVQDENDLEIEEDED